MYILAAFLKNMAAIKIKGQIWNASIAKIYLKFMVCSPCMQNFMLLSFIKWTIFYQSD